MTEIARLAAADAAEFWCTAGSPLRTARDHFPRLRGGGFTSSRLHQLQLTLLPLMPQGLPAGQQMNLVPPTAVFTHSTGVPPEQVPGACGQRLGPVVAMRSQQPRPCPVATVPARQNEPIGHGVLDASGHTHLPAMHSLPPPMPFGAHGSSVPTLHAH